MDEQELKKIIAMENAKAIDDFKKQSKSLEEKRIKEGIVSGVADELKKKRKKELSQKKLQSDNQIKEFSRISGLVDEEFIRTLISYNVQAKWAKPLSDYHKSKDRLYIYKYMLDNRKK